MVDSGTRSKQKILIVDDDPVAGSFLIHALQSRGYQVVYFQHPTDALDCARRESFALAFVDVHMPEMSGLELISLLKRDNPEIEIVLVSGYGSLDDAVKVIKIGINDYLKKPFSIEEVSFCLNRFEERRRISDRLRRTEEKYEQLVQNLPLVIFVLNQNMELTFINKACESLLGYTPYEAIALHRRFPEIIHSEDRERIVSRFRNFFQGECVPFKEECRLVHKKGHTVYTLIQTLPLRSYSEKEPCELEGIIIDITDRVFYERSIVQQEKLKTLGAIATEVAHEIRNPLTSIGGFARRIKAKYPDLREADIILQETHRLEKLLNRIRNYLQPVDLKKVYINANSVIERCYELLQPEMEHKGVTCAMELDENPPYIFVDPNILLQVLINLFKNAIEGSKKHKKFWVRSFVTENHVHIQCATPLEEGITVDCETIFLPFSEGGRSVGLPLSHRLVKNMGGLLTCTQEDHEAVFTVTFPIAKPHECDQSEFNGAEVEGDRSDLQV
ncbi:hybrid sensor histidine kinase/response regulator [Thermodesulforhabdus norvegica]|uniref:histidine kinase n=1 Tax=Thermodesulforhabdus norvegica TaxID=39841 RepID=A0A1I4TDD9_9BACT|nr:hybrid sensor histidine kinase/response regulator [Thermodesulforhabdus norvegica]SFM74702.1 PAS domain S-box-containing protein [Thermodesulforhabdus norvegica]